MAKAVLITGASSGIGKEAATLFARNGFRVIAAARNVQAMDDLKNLGCFVVAMDVTREESIRQAFSTIFSAFGQIDILVNNAGFAQNGFVEELSLAELRYQFDVNVFGLIRVTQMVLPNMRAVKQGMVINVGSVGGDFTSPGASAYHASKYALESFTDGMRQELSVFGIKVVLVKPGGVETNFVHNAPFPQPLPGNPYGPMREKFQNMLNTILDSQNSSFPILKPIEVASAIYKAATETSPKTRIRIGRTARMMPIMKTMLSDKAFDRMILSQLGLTK